MWNDGAFGWGIWRLIGPPCVTPTCVFWGAAMDQLYVNICGAKTTVKATAALAYMRIKGLWEIGLLQEA